MHAKKSDHILTPFMPSATGGRLDLRGQECAVF